MRFEDIVSHPALLDAVRELGWDKPTPIQEKAIPPISEGKDLVGTAQTGTGKTGAFLLPILEKQAGLEGARTLVVCPTRELARQVAADARDFAGHINLHVSEVYGGVPIHPQIKDLKSGWDLLVATPGRLIDHLERGTVRLSRVSTLILDEGDRMLDMGFRPQIERVLKHTPKDRQTLLLSATMPNGVHALALRILADPVWVRTTPDIAVADGVKQRVYSVKPGKKVHLVIALLEKEKMDQVLIFTRTKRGADLLHHRLEASGVRVAVMHGDRKMKQRKRALETFADGEVRVLVATDVAQRGLDIEGISHVINYDVPNVPGDYVHRIGRTGRAGAAGDAITLMTAGEIGQVRSIEYVLGYKLEVVRLEDFDYAGAPPEAANVATNRAGRRLGSRSSSDLSPEELKDLLSVG